MSVWPKRADTLRAKPQGNRVLQFNSRKNFLESCPCSKLRRRVIVNVTFTITSLKAGEQGLDVHFVVIQRVDGVVPWHPLATLS